MRINKAELEKDNKELKDIIEDLMEQREVVRNLHREQLNALAENNFPVDWYVADGSPGAPICFGDSDTGVAVQLYVAKGAVIGVLITNRVDVLGGAGLVPYEVAYGD